MRGWPSKAVDVKQLGEGGRCNYAGDKEKKKF